MPIDGFKCQRAVIGTCGFGDCRLLYGLQYQALNEDNRYVLGCRIQGQDIYFSYSVVALLLAPSTLPPVTSTTDDCRRLDPQVSNPMRGFLGEWIITIIMLLANDQPALNSYQQIGAESQSQSEL